MPLRRVSIGRSQPNTNQLTEPCLHVSPMPGEGCTEAERGARPGAAKSQARGASEGRQLGTKLWRVRAEAAELGAASGKASSRADVTAPAQSVGGEQQGGKAKHAGSFAITGMARSFEFFH